jgi:hypothetical protein
MTLTNHLRLLSKFKNGWSPTSTRQFREHSPFFTFSQRDFRRRPAVERITVSFRNCCLNNFTNRQTANRADLCILHDPQAFIFRAKSDSSSTPQIHFRNRINRSCRRQPGKLNQFSYKMRGRNRFHPPTPLKKTEIFLFFSPFRTVLGPTELSAKATEWELVTLG